MEIKGRVWKLGTAALTFGMSQGKFSTLGNSLIDGVAVDRQFWHRSKTSILQFTNLMTNIWKVESIDFIREL
jgi:hypothetical protein